MGPSVFFSLLVIAVAFMPVFTLVDQEGRLFRPLAYSKNLAMAIAALLAVTLDPAMRMLFAWVAPFRWGLAGDGKRHPGDECRHPRLAEEVRAAGGRRQSASGRGLLAAGWRRPGSRAGPA